MSSALKLYLVFSLKSLLKKKKKKAIKTCYKSISTVFFKMLQFHL